MIRNQYCHSKFFPIGDGLNCRYPVIAGNNRIFPVIFCLCNQIPVDAVPVLHPVRNYRGYYASGASDSFEQNIRRLHSVHVIIPDDSDSFLIKDFLMQNLRQAIHILHKMRRMQMGKVRMQIRRDLCIVHNIPVSYDARRNLVDSVFFPDGLEISSLSRHKPFFCSDCHGSLL